MKQVYKLWVEWELGQDDVVFTSEEKALEWLKERLPDFGIEESVDDLLESYDCGVDEIEVI